MVRRIREEFTMSDTSKPGANPEPDFPSNSHKKKKEAQDEMPEKEKREIKQITKTAATKKKKSLGQKISETFSGDEDSVGSYIMRDIIIPTLKDLLFNAVSGGVEMKLFGKSRGRGRSRNRGYSNGYTSYETYSNQRREPEISRRGRANHDFGEIILDSRADAEDVLAEMSDLVYEYGDATVAQLYQLVGITPDFTDHKYGWDNLDHCRPQRLRNGWGLSLPRPIPLD